MTQIGDLLTSEHVPPAVSSLLERQPMRHFFSSVVLQAQEAH